MNVFRRIEDDLAARLIALKTNRRLRAIREQETLGKMPQFIRCLTKLHRLTETAQHGEQSRTAAFTVVRVVHDDTQAAVMIASKESLDGFGPVFLIEMNAGQVPIKDANLLGSGSDHRIERLAKAGFAVERGSGGG